MISRLRLGCGRCKPEKVEPKIWLCSPESQPMKPEAGRPSATSVAKVAEDQNGEQ